MNYIELINQFWAKDAEYHFSDKETALYFYLLKVCNSARWQNPFGLSNHATIAKFGWGKMSFDRARKRLKDAGLIDFRAGLGRGNIYQYIIRDVNSVPKQGKVHQPDIFCEHIPEKESEKGIQRATFCQEKGAQTDTFSVMFFGKEFEKGTQTNTFCEHFSEKGIEKGTQTNTFFSPKPPETKDIQKPLNNKHISINIDNDIIDIEDNKEIIKSENENHNLIIVQKNEKEKSCAKKEKENEVLELFRSKCPSFPKILIFSVKRREKMMRRLSEMGSINMMEQVFCKMEKSDFLKGNNKYGWKASFDWVFQNSDNWMKILEGNYDNRTAPQNIVKPANDARFMGMLQTDLSKF